MMICSWMPSSFFEMFIRRAVIPDSFSWWFSSFLIYLTIRTAVMNLLANEVYVLYILQLLFNVLLKVYCKSKSKNVFLIFFTDNTHFRQCPCGRSFLFIYLFIFFFIFFFLGGEGYSNILFVTVLMPAVLFISFWRKLNIFLL